MNHSFSSQVNMTTLLTFPDWLVFFLVLALTFLAVLVGFKMKNSQGKRQDNFLDYLLMGRQLTLPLFVATLVATWYGGIFGVTQIAFEKGIYNFVTQGFFWYCTYLIFAFFLVKKIRRYEATTLPDLVGKMFGPKSEKVSAVFNVINVLPVAYVISVGLFIQALFGWELLPSMIVGVSIVMAYSLAGGFRAVVFSDILQFFVMCSGVFFVLVFSVTTFGGLDFLQENLPPEYFSPTGGVGLGTTLVWGFIALATLVDPSFYQRCFAAKTDKVAKNGILISTCIWIGFDICTTAGGMYARAVIPQADSGQAYLVYSMQLLPPGMRGFVLAGILATIISTLESFVFIAGTTVAYDLVPKKYKENLKLQKLSVLIAGIFAVVLASGFEGNIRAVWKTLGSYSAACLLLPMILGHLFPKKISDNQFIFSSALGALAVTFWRLQPREGFWAEIDELYAGILATALGTFLFYLYRLLFGKAQKIPVSSSSKS